jgi:hypothetical protein
MSITQDALREYKRKWAADRRADMMPGEKAKARFFNRRSYYRKRAERLAYARAWKAAHKEHIKAYRHRYYLAHKLADS